MATGQTAGTPGLERPDCAHAASPPWRSWRPVGQPSMAVQQRGRWTAGVEQKVLGLWRSLVYPTLGQLPQVHPAALRDLPALQGAAPRDWMQAHSVSEPWVRVEDGAGRSDRHVKWSTFVGAARPRVACVQIPRRLRAAAGYTAADRYSTTTSVCCRLKVHVV